MDDYQELKHYKLVRDRIPELLKSKGIQFTSKIVDGADYELALSHKLQEEVHEYIQANENGHQLEELADILEVIDAILEAKGTTLSALDSLRQKKKETNGGFSQGIFLEKTITQGKGHKPTDNCIFCRIPSQDNSNIIANFRHCYVIKDAYPVSPGHLLIIPYEHTLNWFTASQEVRADIVKALDAMKIKLDSELRPDGYNIGMNCGVHAGQSVMHLHVHLIPRYQGDMDNPKGGVRGVIPSKQYYG